MCVAFFALLSMGTRSRFSASNWFFKCRTGSAIASASLTRGAAREVRPCVGESGEETYVVKHLDRHLDVGGLPSNDDQTLALAACCTSRHTRRHRARLHDLDLARAHVANLVDLASTLANDTPHQIVGDVYLLGLDLRGRHAWCARRGSNRRRGTRVERGGGARDVGRAGVRGVRDRSAGGVAWAVRRVGGGRHAFLRLDEDVADVVRGNVDGVGNTGNGENALQCRMSGR